MDNNTNNRGARSASKPKADFNRFVSDAESDMTTAKVWTDEYAKMLDDCEERESRMTEWESDFCDSLSSQIDRGRVPTDKQIETLDRIWEKATARG